MAVIGTIQVRLAALRKPSKRHPTATWAELAHAAREYRRRDRRTTPSGKAWWSPSTRCPPRCDEATLGAMPIPAPMPTELTVEAWVALDEDVEGELVDGQLVEEEVASWAHEIVVSSLIFTLRTWLIPRGGFVLGSETKLPISPTRGRKPDVLAYFGTRTGPRLPAPDIVIEVITATPRDRQRDRIDKKHDYATLGVGQYWIVDPEARTLEVLVRQPDGRFLEALAVAAGTHDIPGCSGLRLDLDALWLEIDQGASFFADLEDTDSGA